jgi:hypothetical protein
MVDTSFPKESDLREIRNVQQREAAQKLQEWVLLDIGVAIDGFEFCVQQQDRDLLSASVTEIKMDVLQRPLDREIKASFASFNIADASLVIPMQVVTVGSMQATIISAEPDSPFVASPVDVVSQQAQVTAAGIELAVRLGFVKNVMDLEACFGKAMFAFENPTRAAVDDAEEGIRRLTASGEAVDPDFLELAQMQLAKAHRALAEKTRKSLVLTDADIASPIVDQPENIVKSYSFTIQHVVAKCVSENIDDPPVSTLNVVDIQCHTTQTSSTKQLKLYVGSCELIAIVNNATITLLRAQSDANCIDAFFAQSAPENGVQTNTIESTMRNFVASFSPDATVRIKDWLQINPLVEAATTEPVGGYYGKHKAQVQAAARAKVTRAKATLDQNRVKIDVKLQESSVSFPTGQADNSCANDSYHTINDRIVVSMVSMSAKGDSLAGASYDQLVQDAHLHELTVVSQIAGVQATIMILPTVALSVQHLDLGILSALRDDQRTVTLSTSAAETLLGGPAVLEISKVAITIKPSDLKLLKHLHASIVKLSAYTSSRPERSADSQAACVELVNQVQVVQSKAMHISLAKSLSIRVDLLHDHSMTILKSFVTRMALDTI